MDQMLIELGNLLAHEGHGPAVQNDVVIADHNPKSFRRSLQNGYSDKRRYSEIKTAFTILCQELIALLKLFALCKTAQVLFQYLKLYAVVHRSLRSFAIIGCKRTAQYFMPVNNALPGHGERGNIKWP